MNAKETTPPHVSIIIPTRNAGGKLDAVLKAVFNNKVEFVFEVIISDSESTDNTREIASKYPVNLIKVPVRHFSHGGIRNFAAQQAKGQILVFLTGDAIPKDENWLSILVRDLKDEDVAGVFGRQIPSEDASPLAKFFTQYLYPDNKIIKNSINPNNCHLSDIFFSDVNSAMRKSYWENNKFDEHLIMSEDQAFAKNALIKRKQILYEPNAIVWHSHNYSILKLMQRNFDSGMSLRGVVNATFGKNMAFAIPYLNSGIHFFLEKKLYLWLLIFPIFEIIRFFGFFLGFHSKFLPLFLKKRLSLYKAYWLFYESSKTI